MTDRLGLALVGAGRMGRTHLQALALAQLVELRAICEPSEGVAASLVVDVPVDREFDRKQMLHGVPCFLKKSRDNWPNTHR